MTPPAVAAPIRTVEILTAQPAIQRAIEALSSLTRSAPETCRLVQTTQYAGGSDWLLVWGPGEPTRAAAIRRQVAAGGHAIALDLAYWSRQRKIRISIDAAHPQAWVMRRPLPATRLATDRPPTARCWDPSGAILVAEVGCKAARQYGGATVTAWEQATIAEARAVLGHKRPVIQRPKKPAGVYIDRVLSAGVALVVTYHSNVAVDAIRFGIPVICKEGAAAAVCPATVTEKPAPLPIEIRDQFLSNLAWFQWDLAREAPACWAFLEETLS